MAFHDVGSEGKSEVVQGARLDLARVMDDQSPGGPGRKEPETAPPHTPPKDERGDRSATLQDQRKGRPDPDTAPPRDPHGEGGDKKRPERTALLNEKQRNYPHDWEKNREPKTAPPRVPTEQDPDKGDKQALIAKYMKKLHT